MCTLFQQKLCRKYNTQYHCFAEYGRTKLPLAIQRQSSNLRMERALIEWSDVDKYHFHLHQQHHHHHLHVIISIILSMTRITIVPDPVVRKSQLRVEIVFCQSSLALSLRFTFAEKQMIKWA